ncbi:MAG: presenilin family intramembrane aspartyl protease [bacterium]|nr:presenilin family intramembrane aspartyl protease [bacterium]
MKKIHIRLLSHTIVLFVIAQVLAMIVADHIRALGAVSLVGEGEMTLTLFLTYFVLATLVVLLLTKLYRGHFFYRLIFLLALGAGLVVVFQLVFPLNVSLFISAIFCLGLYFLPIIWVHNIGVIIASAGLGSVLGLQMSWQVAAWLLAVLSAYDVFAVFVTGHMIHLEQTFIARKASFALVIPESWYGLYEQLGTVRPSGGFLILGGGDVILPMFLTIAIAPVNLLAAIYAIVGSLFGLLANHIVLMKWQHPIPALPMIAAGCLAGLAIGIFL